MIFSHDLFLGCKEEHDSKTAQFTKSSSNSSSQSQSQSQSKVDEKSLTRVKEGEETIQGKPFKFECPPEQAVSKCGCKQAKTNDGKSDVVFKINCQKVDSQKQVNS